MSIQIYYEIQKRLRLKGENFTHAAGRLGTTRQHLRHALLGEWKGPKAESIVAKICESLDIPPPDNPKDEVDKSV